jgi:hypothetical protein
MLNGIMKNPTIGWNIKHITITETITAINRSTINSENMLPASCINSLLVSLIMSIHFFFTVAPNKKPGHLSEPGLVCSQYTNLAQQMSFRITFGGFISWSKIVLSVFHIYILTCLFDYLLFLGNLYGLFPRRFSKSFNLKSFNYFGIGLIDSFFSP